MTEWMRLAMQRSVVRRAVSVTAVIGTVLITINHGDVLLSGDISMERLIRMCLTVLVPYGVSTYSSVEAIRQRPSPVEPENGSIVWSSCPRAPQRACRGASR